jgi:antagonist of KipI
LLGNERNAPVIELHFPAGSFEFESDRHFAVGGADFWGKLNGRAIDNHTVIKASSGSMLSFERRNSGNRAYLAIEGGFEADRWLGSASTNLRAAIGGFQGRRLRTGDRVEFADRDEAQSYIGTAIGPSFRHSYRSPATVRVTAAPEFEILTALSEQILFESTFEISRQSDRMGFRLSGEPLFRIDDREMLSSGVTFGTIQLLPDGQMIALMADHQTTGGYPRIVTVASVDLPVLAQMAAGDRVSFERITTDEAERAYCELERSFAFLRFGVSTRSVGVL